MSRGFLSKEEYYRPQQAAELRRQAKRLAWCARGLNRNVCSGWVLPGVSVTLVGAVLLARDAPPGSLRFAAALSATVLATAAAASWVLWDLVFKAAEDEEVRRPASRLEWRQRIVAAGGCYGTMACLILAYAAVMADAPQHWTAGALFVAIGMLVFLFSVPALARRRVRRLRGQAAALEAEHQARYGPEAGP